MSTQQLEFNTPETHRGNTALLATYVSSYPKIEVHGILEIYNVLKSVISDTHKNSETLHIELKKPVHKQQDKSYQTYGEEEIQNRRNACK